MSDTNAIIDVGEIDPKTGRPKLSWTWDTEIWAPCRLGEAFTLRDLGHEKEQYLYGIKADWMGQHGDAMCVRSPGDLEKEHPQVSCLGAGPRPWACCWTYEPKIKITPPVWCWKMQEDTMFGLELKPKRNGSRRKAKLDCVMIHKGRPVYCIVVETSDGESRRYYDSIPVLDPYFAPIWPATAEETQEVTEPAPEPVADPVADQTTDSENSTDVAILPSLANCQERDTRVDALAAASFALTPEPPALELKEDRNKPPELSDSLRRELTATRNISAGAVIAMAAAIVAGDGEEDPTGIARAASWDGLENKPPGACIGGRTPFSGKYYYYVWFEEPTTEGETYEQKAGP